MVTISFALAVTASPSVPKPPRSGNTGDVDARSALFDLYGDHLRSRASLRTWLYRIATNACLSALEGRARRPLPSGLGVASDDPGTPLVPDFAVPWLQPLPGSYLVADQADPLARATERDGVRLALDAAMQLLAPRERAVLVLRDVPDFSAAEVATQLDTSVAAAYCRGDAGVLRLHTLQVFTVTTAGIARNVVFADPQVLAIFGLAPVLEP